MTCRHEQIEHLTTTVDLALDGDKIGTVDVETLWCPFCGGFFTKVPWTGLPTD